MGWLAGGTISAPRQERLTPRPLPPSARSRMSSNQMYLSLSLVKRKAAQFSHNRDEWCCLVWLKCIFFMNMWKVPRKHKYVLVHMAHKAHRTRKAHIAQKGHSTHMAQKAHRTYIPQKHIEYVLVYMAQKARHIWHKKDIQHMAQKAHTIQKAHIAQKAHGTHVAQKAHRTCMAHMAQKAHTGRFF